MIRWFALVFGIVYTLVGVWGLAVHGMDQETDLLFGIFPVNGLHNITHLVFGIPGIVAYFMGWDASRLYAQVIGVVLVVVGLLGIVAPDMFGLMPIGGADIALHLVTGLVAIYFGFVHREDRVRRAV